MIRFRLGKSWEREGAGEDAGGPRDSFGLSVDGVELLPGASEEPLVEVGEDLAKLAVALSSSEEAVAELSLPESHVELVFWRKGDQGELAVVSLERPARIVKGPLELDVHELVAAARATVEALQASLSKAGMPERAKKISKLLRAKPAAKSARGARADAPSGEGESAPLAFGFQSHGKRPKPSSGALSSLLFPGELYLSYDGERVWTSPGVPFLFALELSRQGFDLHHAIETGMTSFSFSPGGLGEKLSLDFASKRLTLPSGEPVSADPLQLCRALFSLGVATDAALGAGGRRPVPLKELAARCHEGLAQLRPPTPRSDDEITVISAATLRERRHKAAKPLEERGEMKHLLLQPLFEVSPGKEPSTLVMTAAGPVVIGAEFAAHLGENGETLERFEGPHGVSVSTSGWVLVGKEHALHGHRLGVPGARFIRHHEVASLGTELHEAKGHLLTASARTVVSVQLPTGREAWRFSPGRNQRLQLGLVHPFAMVSTEQGQLLALDVRTGEAAFRIRAGVPFQGPAVAAKGGRALVRLGHPNQVAVIGAELAGGQLGMNADVKLSLSSLPLPAAKGSFFVAGEQDGEGVLLLVDERGKTRFTKKLHLGHGPFSLLELPDGVAVCARDGGCVVFEADGEIRFRVGGGDARLEELVTAARLGDVLFVPGETVRALQLSSGEVVGQLSAPSLLSLVADEGRKLVYTLETTGRVRAFSVGTKLAVVEPAAAPQKKKGPKRKSRSGPKSRR